MIFAHSLAAKIYVVDEEVFYVCYQKHPFVYILIQR